MKIRNGFVSNSSSSSFLIYGVAVDRSELEGMLDEKGIGDVWEFHTVAEEAGLEAHFPDGYDSVYFGLSWDDVRDDETGAQFKQRVVESLKKMGFKAGFVPSTLSETYYS
jgi:hypothetical protein